MQETIGFLVMALVFFGALAAAISVAKEGQGFGALLGFAGTFVGAFIGIYAIVAIVAAIAWVVTWVGIFIREVVLWLIEAILFPFHWLL